ncbi:MAG: nucleotide exchange factor GrpE [Bacteroidales bacterium 36-12]|jgi:molecular chaperone GrpE|nr:MAG: nucleotide exchange factor GrpE [Bacteroidales bacterium 36-12]
MKKRKEEEVQDNVVNENNTNNEEKIVDETTVEEEAKKIREDIESLSQEVSDLKDKNLRLMAEFDNFRKRTAKEKLELIQNAGEGLLTKILPLIDDFERALQAMETAEDVQAVKEGVDLIYLKFISFLSDNGVNVISTENEEFNTDLHEAVTTFPAPTEEQKGKIIDCVSKGYIMNEKVIRFAKVVVGE